jgi:hypothetical protein
MGTSGPRTYNRAATSVIRARCRLDQAHDEIRLALEILGAPEEGVAGWPGEPAERQVAVRGLEELLERIEATRRLGARSWRQP